jgi:SAM-dependent methyltransferase
MREELLEVLAEPETGAKLRLEVKKSHGAIIEEGSLLSETTGRRYPITRGIPRFVDDEIYAESFGFQWNAFRTVQLDSTTRASNSRRRFETEAGWTREEIDGKWLLDAGCGAGRFAEIVAERGPKLVALDYSSAVEAASKTLERFPNAHVVQGNLLSPPFRHAAFDYAYCIGVAQHTPSPTTVVANVVRCVKPGGHFAFTIYARRPWTKLHAKYLVRPVTKRLPEPMLRGVIERTMPVLFPISDVLFRLPVVGKIARFTIPIANWIEHTDLTREQRYAEAVLDTFDALSPKFDLPMTHREVEAIFHKVGAKEWTFRTKIPINVVGEA